MPDTVLSGYFDSMPVAMMAGQCWKALLETVPGFRPLNLARFVHCGLRDVSDAERERVSSAGYPVVWGDTERNVDFREELGRILDRRPINPAMVHLDLDVLDSSVGQVNKFAAAPGGILEEDFIGCLKMLAGRVRPLSLTVASFDPTYDSDDRVVGIAIRGVIAFVRSLIDSGVVAVGGEKAT